MGCGDVLQQNASCRCAMNGLLAVVLEEHIKTHLVDADAAESGQQGDAWEQLIDIVHSYFK